MRRAKRDPGSRAREKTWRPRGDRPKRTIVRTPADKFLCRAACGPDWGESRPGHDSCARGLKSGRVVANDGAPARYRAGAPFDQHSCGEGRSPAGSHKPGTAGSTPVPAIFPSLLPPPSPMQRRRFQKPDSPGANPGAGMASTIRRAPACAERSPKPPGSGAAPGRRAFPGADPPGGL